MAKKKSKAVKTATKSALSKGVDNHYASEARQYYKSLNWAELWDDFCFSIHPNGALKYKTAWSFAKAIGKTNKEASVIYQAIGPEATPGPHKVTPVPWQGDWHARREKGFWFDPEGDKLEVLKDAIKLKADSLDVLKQFTVVPAKLLAMYQEAAKKVIEHYSHQPLIEGLSEDENYKRATHMLRLLERCQAGISGSIDDLAKCLGLHPGAPDKWADLALISAENVTKAALAGQEHGMLQGGSIASDYVRTLTGMVGMVINKSKSFELPLPDTGEEANGKHSSEVVGR